MCKYSKRVSPSRSFCSPHLASRSLLGPSGDFGHTTLSSASHVAAAGEDATFSHGGLSHSALSHVKQWFDDANTDVFGRQSAQVLDGTSALSLQTPASHYADDPPFYLDRQFSTAESYAIAASTHTNDGPGQKRSPRTAGGVDPTFNQLPGNSVEDYRSVIDDLTIENKKLKRKLRHFEKDYHAPLDSDKLFELRVHGLTTNKKRKLERTLQDFSVTAGRIPEVIPPPLDIQHPSFPTQHGFAALKAASSFTSNPRPGVDSAYASMSTSCSTSIPHSRRAEGTKESRPAQLSRVNERECRILPRDDVSRSPAEETHHHVRKRQKAPGCSAT